jgi:2-phosphoglycerate kinase
VSERRPGEPLPLGAVDGLPQFDAALVMHVVLPIPGDELHRPREIRKIQASIADRAEQKGVPVIESRNPNRATADVTELVLSSAESLEVAL